MVMSGVSKDNTSIAESKKHAAERWIAKKEDGIKNVAAVWLHNPGNDTYDVLLKCYPDLVSTTDDTTQ